MDTDPERARRAARRAYELGRLRVGLLRAAAVATTTAAAAGLLVGRRAVVWMPATFTLWVLIEWRGTWLGKGARRGLLAGVFTLMLPLSLLRPCCNAMTASPGDGCAGGVSKACAIVGVLIGLSLALLIPNAPRERRVEAALGMVLGAASVVVLRCAPLLAGEAVGLLGGLVAGVAAASLAHAWAARHRTA